MQSITVRGARTHNLKNIDLVLPRDKLIVVTGPSGSGKSSLAFDTLYAEGQRRYVESLSAYARQFLSMMEKPDVDHIEGLSPAISIQQKSTSHNPRSTVGTITEVYDYLRLLYARAGEPKCPTHQFTLKAQTVSQMVDTVLELPAQTKCMLLAPIIEGRKGEHKQLLTSFKEQGYIRARIDDELVELDDPPTLNPKQKHTIEIVIDRFKVRSDLSLRLAESFETTLKIADGSAKILLMDQPKAKPMIFSSRFACPQCGYSISELAPKLFSFNNPSGACGECDGLGVHQFFDPERVVTRPELSLTSGAIPGWDRRHGYYHQMLQSLAKHYDFSMDTPFKKLSKKIKNILLYGNDEEIIEFNYRNERGQLTTRRRSFHGIIPTLQRRYHETDSSTMKEELNKYITNEPCPECHATRLNQAARHVFVAEKSLPEITAMPIHQTFKFFKQLKLTGYRKKVADKIQKEILDRLSFLMNVGLDYLNLSRSAETLSGGEAQRIRLASQIGAGLVGVMYILDEPTIGLHQRDNDRLLSTLKHLRDLGNTVIVVEHDEDTMRTADYLVDLGQGAGVHGGEIVAQGTPNQVCKNKNSLTGQYLSGKKSIAVPAKRSKPDSEKVLRLSGASGNNLKSITAEFPLGLLTCITGVSGSGKSTLINDTLYPLVANDLIGASDRKPAAYDHIEGIEYLDKIVDIDQSPIGRTPRSNPATYTGIFTPVRELFSGTPEARARGYNPGRFSFNVKGGRCEACQGDGLIRVEMHFLPDIYVVCDICQGKRYNRETLDIQYKQKNIHDVLNLTIEEAREFFDAIPNIARKCQTLIDVGLGYLTLGQNATTLSGGEAQRVKLARELSKRDTGRTLYLLDEPTTGLHFGDVDQLLKVLHRLRDHGNTVIIIEHNLDVIKTADWIIDLGPEGGDGGGKIVVAGPPEKVVKHKKSYTSQYLAPMLK